MKICSLEVSSCNGFVLLCHFDFGMILWNPVIRKYKRIPMPRLLQQEPCIVWPKFGFAYDFVAEDYQVLYVHLVSEDTLFRPYTVYPRYIAGIYFVKNQSWTTIGNPIFHCTYTAIQFHLTVSFT